MPSMKHKQALKKCRMMMSSLTLRSIEDSITVAVMPTTDGEQGSKEREWSVEGVMMMSLTPQDPRPIDQECDSHDPWYLLS